MTVERFIEIQIALRWRWRQGDPDARQVIRGAVNMLREVRRRAAEEQET